MEAYCVKCKTKREMQNPQPLFNARGAAVHQRRLPGVRHCFDAPWQHAGARVA